MPVKEICLLLGATEEEFKKLLHDTLMHGNKTIYICGTPYPWEEAKAIYDHLLQTQGG